MPGAPKENPRRVNQRGCSELGVARWNDLKFVPERTFEDVITDVRALHGLENWKPEAEN
jgi:hypothetical protein